MSTQITGQTEHLKDILDTYRTGKLSEGLQKDVQAIRGGIFVPTDSNAKPVLYVGSGRLALVRVLGGNRATDARMKWRLSGAVEAATQDLAQIEAELLLGNLLQVLNHHTTQTDYWSAGSPGWGYPSDDESGEDVVEFGLPDVGERLVTMHFTLYWSANCRIIREEL